MIPASFQDFYSRVKELEISAYFGKSRVQNEKVGMWTQFLLVMISGRRKRFLLLLFWLTRALMVGNGDKCSIISQNISKRLIIRKAINTQRARSFRLFSRKPKNGSTKTTKEQVNRISELTNIIKAAMPNLQKKVQQLTLRMKRIAVVEIVFRVEVILRLITRGEISAQML